MIGAAVDSTLEAATASFTMELNSPPGGITMRYRGVCDFTHQRLAAHVDVETEPADPSDEPAGGGCAGGRIWHGRIWPFAH
jgi:hypothetical protein